MKFVSLNIRGLGQERKKNAVKDLVLKYSPTVLALVETKQPKPTLQLICHVWGHKPSQWAALPANGASGGIWVVWNPQEHTLISSHLGDFSVTDMRDFIDFITRNELIDIPLQGGLFTWSNHSPNPTLSKLDRFLFSTSWEEFVPSSIALALPKPVFDHCPMLLDTNAVQRGPKPFRFELAWLQETSLVSLLPTWWSSFSPQVRGRAGCRLQTKIQLLTNSLKTWSKTLPGNYSKTKSLILDSIQSLDL
ncbi:hypothetical protein AMTRI_Chr03g140160 [Amborella trichopoda]